MATCLNISISKPVTGNNQAEGRGDALGHTMPEADRGGIKMKRKLLGARHVSRMAVAASSCGLYSAAAPL